MSAESTLLIDLGQLVLDLAGIADPTGVADASSAAISLLRGRLLDAGISLLGVVPYLGDVAKVGKLPHYLNSIRKACQLGLEDVKFGRKLKAMLPEVQRLLGKLKAMRLPEAVKPKLLEMEAEIEKFLLRYDRAVLSRVRIRTLLATGAIRNARLADVTQHALRSELLKSGIREAHNAHFFKQLVERGPKRGIQTLGEFVREFNSGIRQVGKEEGTVEVLLVRSNAKAVLNLDGELVTFVISEFGKMIR